MSVQEVTELGNKIISDLKQKNIPYSPPRGVYAVNALEYNITRHTDGEGEELYRISGFPFNENSLEIPKESVELSLFLNRIDISVDAADLLPELKLRERYVGEKQEIKNELRIGVNYNKIDVELFIFDTHVKENDFKIIGDYFSKYGVEVNLTQNDKEASISEFNNHHNISSIMKGVYDNITSG